MASEKDVADIAREEIRKLCQSERRWTMCVPVQPDDSDMIFLNLVMEYRAVCEERDELLDQIKSLEFNLEQKSKEIGRSEHRGNTVDYIYDKCDTYKRHLGEVCDERDSYREALEFYAKGGHFREQGGDAYTPDGKCCEHYMQPENPSGEPLNYLEGHGDYGYEDGSIAKAALKKYKAAIGGSNDKDQ